jgi:hypothetical protein
MASQKILVSNMMMIERNGDNFEVNVDGYVVYSVDKNYATDADGNRGTMRTFVEDVTDIDAVTVEGESVELTEREIEQAEEILIQKFFG